MGALGDHCCKSFCLAPIYSRERRFFDTSMPNVRLRNNSSNVGPTSLLQILIREMVEGRTDTITDWGDGEWKVSNRKYRKLKQGVRIRVVGKGRRAVEKTGNGSKESL